MNKDNTQLDRIDALLHQLLEEMIVTNQILYRINRRLDVVCGHEPQNQSHKLAGMGGKIPP